MKKLVYILFAIWVAAALALKLFVGASWWLATSWLWIPLGVALTIALAVFGSVDIGGFLKRREDAKIPSTCENCLFNYTKKYDSNGKCLGDAMKAEHKEGEVCQYYRRHIERK